MANPISAFDLTRAIMLFLVAAVSGVNTVWFFIFMRRKSSWGAALLTLFPAMIFVSAVYQLGIFLQVHDVMDEFSGTTKSFANTTILALQLVTMLVQLVAILAYFRRSAKGEKGDQSSDRTSVSEQGKVE
jgi:hypothetical protein